MSRTPQRSSRTANPHRHAALVADMSRLVRRALAERFERLEAPASNGTDHTALFVARAHDSIAPARMAAQQRGKPGVRAQTRELYERCLQHYRETLRAVDAQRGIDDVGAAIARFVAVNIHVLRNGNSTPRVRITSKMLLRMERQLSAVVHEGSVWSNSSAVDRQFYFEQMAILSVLLVETSRYATSRGPAAVAEVQSAAREYLQQFLGIDPDLLTLGPDGLTLAGDEPAFAARPSRFH